MKKTILIMVMVVLLAAAVQAEGLLEINLEVMKDDNVTGDIKVSLGASSTYTNESGGYNLRISDVANSVIWSKTYDLNFVVLTDPGMQTDYELINEKIEYDIDMYKLTLYYDGEEIYTRYLDFCDKNLICDNNENYISCPNDCLPGIRDGLCISKENLVCDPDCLENIDKDCEKIEKKRNWARVLLIIFFGLLAVSLVIGYYEREKLKEIINETVVKIKKSQIYQGIMPWLLKQKERVKKAVNNFKGYFK